MFASTRQRAPMRGSIPPSFLRRQPPFHFFWFSHSLGKPMPGLVSTLLNQAYSTPSRLVHTFLQVTEQVWQPMHLSRFRTIATWARTFITLYSSGRSRRGRLVHPINLVHLAQDHELVAVRADS